MHRIKSNKKNENATRVVCPNCGTEMAIPAHGTTMVGHVIGADSGLGTVVLQAANTGGNVKKPSVDELANELLAKFGDNVEVKNLVVALMSKIDESDYIDVDGIVRRWIPSQTLRMMGARRSDKHLDDFHRSLQLKGIDYQWKVLIDELEKQYKLLRCGDIEQLAERRRWYNAKLAFIMAGQVMDELKEAYDNAPVKSCRGRKYVPVCHRSINGGRGMFVGSNEFDELLRRFDKAQRAILNFLPPHNVDTADSARQLLGAVVRFNNLRRDLVDNKYLKQKMNKWFANSYKAAGAYYTLKDFVMFEGYKMRGKRGNLLGRDASLLAIEDYFSKLCVFEEGYKGLGLLKEFLITNGFKYEDVVESWKSKSEARKTERHAARNGRRRRN